MTRQNSYKEEQEVSQYEKLAVRTKELLEAAREKTPKTVEEALEKAREEMIAAGEFSREQGRRVEAFLRRDLEASRDYVAHMGQTLKEAFEPQRVASGIQSTLAHILDTFGDTLKEFASKTEERLTYRTGELSSPGTLTCNSCRNRIQMNSTGKVPPCAKCHSTEFLKSY